MKKVKKKLEAMGISIRSLDMMSMEEDIPSNGVYIPIFSKAIQPHTFKKIELNKRINLFCVQG